MNIRLILRKAIISSLYSKIINLLMNIVVVSVIADMLNNNDFSKYLFLSTIGGWLTIFTSGVTPFLVSVIVNKESKPNIIKSFNTGVVYLFSICVIFLVIIYILNISGFFLSIESFNNKNATLLTLFLLLFSIPLSISDAVRTGRQETHIINYYSAISSTLIIITFLSARFLNIKFSLDYVMFFSFFWIVLFKFINFLSVINSIKWFEYGFIFDFSNIKIIFKNIVSFIVISASTLISVQLLLLLLSVWGMINTISEVGTLLKYYTLCGSFLTLISVPMWPLLMGCTGNKKEFKRISKKILFFNVCFGFSLMIITIFFGENIFRFWTQGKVDFNSLTLFLIGLRFLFISYNQYQILILKSIESYSFIGKVILFESFVLIAFVLIFKSSISINLILLFQIIPSVFSILIMRCNIVKFNKEMV